MSFQDIENGGKLPTFGLNSSLQNPSQAVAAGIFQINTAVDIFRRLVDAIGTSQDTPEPRQKMHKTRLRIGQLVKETSAKLRVLSDYDHGSNKAEDAKVARDFQAVLQDFQKVQRLAAERESAYLSSSPPTSFPSRF
ncbi:PREDICTED: syntaxin-22-like isoform X2 [Nelumbo nucifera]|uniref:Syntaxin-22-like isoform X2 n=1 Tax=Nelumbo nucifera TaxID=4432 RepID=A0A1U7ZQK8_NELNU|nr:PREDICTED: syntaxin-22-like isoform X2 [Nelumbo nucifera]